MLIALALSRLPYVGDSEIDDGVHRDQRSSFANATDKISPDTTCPSPLDAMKRAHQSYGIERRLLLSSLDMEYVKNRRWDDSAFADSCGVAGIRNQKAIKCLHAHAAHYWSGNSDNVVGRWVSERLKSPKDKSDKCTIK